MSLKKRRDEPGPDDDVDPALYFEDEGPEKKEDHRTRRLCGQVARTLALVFPGGLGDDAFADCAVVSVEPAPDSTRLLVTIGPGRPDATLDARAVAAGLERIRGYLRAEIAGTLTRKRAPNLIFRIEARAPAPPAPGGPPEDAP